MGDPTARKAIVQELFAATGESIPEDDPIVTGAILFAHKLDEVAGTSAKHMRSAGEQAVAAIHEASQKASLVLAEASQRCAAESARALEKADAAAQAVAAQLSTLSGERLQLIKSVETQVTKAVKLAGRGQASPLSLRYIPAWYAVVGSLAVGFALSAAWLLGIQQGTAHAEEAAVGRAFSRVLPELDPKVREHIVEHLRKKSR